MSRTRFLCQPWPEPESKMYMSVHTSTMHQELCLNPSTSDMPHCKVRLSFKLSILLCKATVLIIHLPHAMLRQACIHHQIHRLLSHQKHLMLVQQPQQATPLLQPSFKFAQARAGPGQKWHSHLEPRLGRQTTPSVRQGWGARARAGSQGAGIF